MRFAIFSIMAKSTLLSAKASTMIFDNMRCCTVEALWKISEGAHEQCPHTSRSAAFASPHCEQLQRRPETISEKASWNPGMQIDFRKYSCSSLVGCFLLCTQSLR